MSQLEQVKLHLVDSMDELFKFYEWCGKYHENDALAFDTETESLDPYRGDKVRLIQIGDNREGWAFPPNWHGPAIEALTKWDKNLVAHNAKFDVGWLERHYDWKAPWHRMHDTISIAHIDDPTRTRGLKPLSGMLIDPRASSSQTILDKEMTQNGWNWKTVPIVREGAGSSYWVYAALDPVLTCMLFDHFKNVRVQFRDTYNLEMGTVRVISEMQARGARVDMDYCRAMIKSINEYSRAMRAWIKQTHNVDNATSNPQCIARFKELGRVITRFTNSGKDSLDKEQLKMFLAGADYNPDSIEGWTTEQLMSLPGNDLADALLKLRKGEKQVGPYFTNFEKLADADSIVHPTIWPVGTRTARMSITDPALQTLPRGDATVRNAFIGREGNMLITIDANQIEMRLAAHFSRDDGLRRAFVESEDFFNTVASDAWGTTITKGDPRRQTMKNASYAKLYTAGNDKIAATAGVPIHTMERLMARFDDSYPGISWLQKMCEQRGKERAAEGGRGYVSTPTGRRMYADKGNERVLVNYLIQSHAAEILKQGICDLDAAGLGEYLILPVHDELVLDVPKEDAQEVGHVLKQTLDNVGANYFVPLTWDADYIDGPWGAKYEKKPDKVAEASQAA